MKQFFIIALMAGFIYLAPCGNAQDFRDREVDEAIKKAQDYLLSQINNEGHWEAYGRRNQENEKMVQVPILKKEIPQCHNYYPVGPTALATYALIESGMSPEHPKVRGALNWLMKADTVKTYSLGLRANAFLAAMHRTEDKARKALYRKQLRQDSEQLIYSTKIGGYDYVCEGNPKESWKSRAPVDSIIKFDNSNSQYGVLGVWAAYREDGEVPKGYWKAVERHWVGTQEFSGGWTYAGYPAPAATFGEELADYVILKSHRNTLVRLQKALLEAQKDQKSDRYSQRWHRGRIDGALRVLPPYIQRLSALDKNRSKQTELKKKYKELIQKYGEDAFEGFLQHFWLLVESGRAGSLSSHSRDVTATMTAAGLASLFVCFEALNAREFIDCKKSELPKSLERGLTWFDENYNSFRRRLTGYLLYGIERVGLASGYKYFGKADWYKIGREQILRRQNGDGSFRLGSRGVIVETSYGMLFLARGRNSVIINKLEFQGDWNNRPRDAANLCRQIGKDLERKLNWQNINLRVPVEELHDAPILYISGAKAPKFTEEELQKLRDFVYQGGLILSVTECGGAGFKEGVREVYAKLFPEYEMQACGKEHPLYSAHFPLSNGQPAFFEITNGVRPLVLHTDTDLSRDWQMNMARTRKNSFQIILNVLLYTMGDLNALRPRGVSHWPEGKATSFVGSHLNVARLKWTGHCNPEPLAYKRLEMMMKKEGGMEVAFVKDDQGRPMIPISKLADSDAKLAWLTGTGKLNLSKADEAALKQFVEKGGVLLIDAAGGNKPFAKSARAMLKRLFDRKLLDIFENNSPIYKQSGRSLGKANWQKKTYKRLTGGKQFRLEGVLLNDKPAVIFSPEDITAGLLGTPFGTVDGYAPSSAFELMRNIFHFAAAQSGG